LEPDECYYLAHEQEMRGKDELDLSVDPPPDLVVEVEVSRSALDRLAIYASMGVPEVWRCDGHLLIVHALQGDGTYAVQTHSTNFPFLPMEKLAWFLGQSSTTDETTLLRSFQQWVREARAAWRR
jgi:Uma2 family endonuclease